MTVAAIVRPEDPSEALADAAGRPAARRIVDAAWAGGALPIIVVVEDPDGRVAASLEGSPARLLDPGAMGEAESFRRGADVAIQSVAETSAVLLWPGRMAWVDPETVTSLIEAHGRAAGEVRRPQRDGVPGWPLLVPASRLAELVPSASGPLQPTIETVDGLSMLELGDPGAVLGLEIAQDALPDYAGPPGPVGGPPPEWGAAAAERPEPESGF